MRSIGAETEIIIELPLTGSSQVDQCLRLRGGDTHQAHRHRPLPPRQEPPLLLRRGEGGRRESLANRFSPRVGEISKGSNANISY